MSPRALLWLACALAGACEAPTPPELLVCMEVTEQGGCVEPRTELVVGRSYAVVARGDGLPERGTLVLERFEDGRAIVLAERPRTRGGRAHIDGPLTLPRVGVYRVTLRDERGHARLSTNVRAPSPSVWRTDRAAPAASPAP